MTSHWAPYLLVRPGGLPFIDEIRADLAAAGAAADRESLVGGWRELSRRLYFDQYGEPGTQWLLQEGAEAWLATTVALYGNRGVLMRFGAGQPTERRQALALQLAEYKQAFRSRRRAQRQRIAVTYAGVSRNWPVYFDCVHVPEPSGNRIAWELSVIEQHLSVPMTDLALEPALEA